MNKIIISFLTFMSLNSFAQQKNESKNDIFKVIYKSSLYKDSESVKDSKLRDKITQYQESFEFELFFDKTKSIYRLVDNINLDDQSIEYQITRGLSNELYYKDLLKKEKIKQTTSLDELFNVVKSFEQYKWVVSSETKVIDGYTCYKATCHYEEYDDNRKMSLSFNPVVWFAPSLPYSFGPMGLDGLPGLVLEGTFNGRVYFYATSIDLNDKTLTKIERPVHGKYVTEEDFRKVLAENYKKMNEMR
ncbi:GLPGLI family protein [Flavobacterium macrobrachii]|uniref:GLPGLI family protein n=1 Tax=Flavobacterium macrobrachii TaxID=591204 RepID=A0ABS2D0D4_9FLAO|nr:GLPGLI family protein [Flavobacterium macrobrachii]MBM6500677.1 GLPGLI family protein [Flavobacterium macrobrachii]